VAGGGVDLDDAYGVKEKVAGLEHGRLAGVSIDEAYIDQTGDAWWGKRRDSVCVEHEGVLGERLAEHDLDAGLKALA